MSEWSGQTLGSYQVHEEIGSGGMAVVYRAYQPQLERWVAIKMLRTEEARGTEFLARFRREARAIAALRHPNILAIYDYGEQRGIAYIVMEYVPGGTLKARLTGQPMPWSEASTFILPVGRALAYAHSQGIVHRDVKPANIFLPRADWPLLGDFGLVKLLGHQHCITRPGVSIGTPAYFSPEQAAGDEVDHRSDIYALTIVLYQLVTGHLPFEGSTAVEMMLRRLQEQPTPAHHFVPQIDPHLDNIILTALSRDPASRYPTMEALVDELARLPGTFGQSIAPPQPLVDHPISTARLDGLSVLSGTRLVVASTGVTIHVPAQASVDIGRPDSQAATLPAVDLEPHGGSLAGVSRHHARLTRHVTGWFLEDLGSTNGTFVNDVCLPPGQPTRIYHGDRLRLGQLVLLFYEG